MPDLKKISKMGAVVGVAAVADPNGTLAEQGAQMILSASMQSGRRADRIANIAAMREGGVKAMSFMPRMAGAAAGAIMGGETAAGVAAGAAAAPEIIGGAAIALTVFEAGYKITTGKNFEQDTKIGSEIRHAKNGAWELAGGATSSLLKGLGMTRAGDFVKNTVVGLMVEPDEPKTQAGKSAEEKSSQPASHAAGQTASPNTIHMKQGPLRPINENDWNEGHYSYDTAGGKQSRTSTPMKTRAYSTMSAMTDDAGLDRKDRLSRDTAVHLFGETEKMETRRPEKTQSPVKGMLGRRNEGAGL